MAACGTIRIYRDRKREWRWSVVAANGRIVADSGESYKRLRDCRRGLLSAGRAMLSGKVVVEGE